MRKKKKLYEGKTKKIYAVDEQEQLIQEFKDDVIGTDGQVAGSIKGKGSINKQISAMLFEYLEGFHIQTHFIKELGTRDMLVKRLEMIPIEIIMTNVAIDKFSKQYGLEQGEELNCPIIEFYLKDEVRQNLMINQSHLIAFKLASVDEVKMIERMTSKINAVLKSYFQRRDLKLIDFKLEFGRFKNKIVLGDELSPETCTLWEVSTDSKLETHVSGKDTATVEKTYEELKTKLIS